MFDFGDANDAQKDAITSTEGPVLITAGPGTGKTYTLVQRTIYLIQECGVKPEEIFIATFTEKAAKELVTRITNELIKHNISININEMYVGTFHSLCMRIIKDHMEYTRIKHNYRLLDAFDQQYMVFRYISRFRDIKGFEALFPRKQGAWKQANEVCDYANNLTEELVEIETLLKDKDSKIKTVGEILYHYKNLLEENNCIDFASIQTECYRLLKDNLSVLEELQDQIRYIMIDEYQDTNYIQEQLVFMLGEKHNNICVVGDDDQGLYRFRGATIRNILEFPNKFDAECCKEISLVINYRSNSDIVDFYNDWMSTTSGQRFKFSWDNFRFEKRIIPHEKTNIKSSAVIKLASQDCEEEWHECVYTFINKLKESGKLTNYNQIAFLFKSVKNEHAKALADFLENNGINVYSPRSNMYFERYEIQFIIGCLLLMFPKYVSHLENHDYDYLQNDLYKYYSKCIKLVNDYVKCSENSGLRQFIKDHGKTHLALSGTTDYGYSGLLYQIFQFEPFSDMLGIDMSLGVTDLRPTRNLARFTQIIGKFEYLYNIDVLDGSPYKEERRIDKNTEDLFNTYLRLLINEGIDEFEDDSEYAPSGCVSFLTIHQSKGMEFPIVFVDSLSSVPRKSYKDLMVKIEEKYFHRPQFEPYDQIKFFDFWRLYYTAFSRAQDLLVLTCNEDNRTPSKYFADIYAILPSADSDNFNVDDFSFKEIKEVNIKDTFSFTSHISTYETCALQYKFYKELEFMPVRQAAMMFGTLVHETIEDMHKAVLRGEEQQVTPEAITQWFYTNYTSLSKSEHTYLAEAQQKVALDQVLRYYELQSDKWDEIKQAEVDVTLVKQDYIIEGKIDLIKGEDDTVEIVDFKAERKPDLEKDRERIEQYRRQLQLYAYLVEQRTGLTVSNMHLHYTAEESSNPKVSFPNSKSAIEGTVEAFDDTIHKILQKEFTHTANDQKTCSNCDFNFYCNQK